MACSEAESLGFQHFDIDVTPGRGELFREAILDLLDMELGARFSEDARLGITALMNYLVGACIYVRGGAE